MRMRTLPLFRSSGMAFRPYSVIRMLGMLAFLTAVPVQMAAAFGSLDRIRDSQSVRIGFRDSELPFSYVDDGSPTGYSIDLCRAVVENLRARLDLPRLDIVYVPASTANRFVLMRSGKVDIECAATTNNAERRKLVDFSYPHFVTTTRFAAFAKAGVSTIADLSGRSVVSLTGTVNIEQLNAVNRTRNLNISVLLSRDHKEAFAMVETGRAIAFVMDDILLAGLVAESGDPQAFIISREAFAGPEPYGLLLPPGDPDFKAAVNAALRDIYANGQGKALYRKWFMSPIPPNGVNLNLPMSRELETIFDDPREYRE